MKEKVIKRAKHPISRQEISPAALKVLYKLKKHGYDAYLVGGCIRDRLLGYAPKDFDVSTNATPEQICEIFRNGIIIGKRFKIVHIRYGREIIEVTTFRQGESEIEKVNQKNTTLVADNHYSQDIRADALRRDFTINALYYNIKNFAIYDYFDGMADLQKGIIRIIGDAEQRYTEDPVRMLRALRFCAKYDFTMAPETQQPIKALAPLIKEVAPARMFDEIIKLFLKGEAEKTLHLLEEQNLFANIFPATHMAINAKADLREFLNLGLRNTDKRVAKNMTVIPAFLYAILLWPSVKILQDKFVIDNPPPVAMQMAGMQSFAEQDILVRIPKRFKFTIKEIWNMQWRLTKKLGKKSHNLLEHPRFKAGYDFLKIRHASGELGLDEFVQYWDKQVLKSNK